MLIAADDVADFAPAATSSNEGWASLKELLECEPGPAMITYLNCVDLDALDDVSHMVAMELVERQQSWLAELAIRITAKVAEPTPTPNPDRVAHEVDDFSAELVRLRSDSCRVVRACASRSHVGSPRSCRCARRRWPL